MLDSSINLLDLPPQASSICLWRPTVSTNIMPAVNNKRKRKLTATATRNRRPEEPKIATAIRITNHGRGEISDIEDFGEDEAQSIRASLLQWYDNNKRDLPWRASATAATISDNNDDGADTRAYAVWVSEVMLQQTRVQTVIDYYNRWMHKWPTLKHLAKASLEEVNEMWAGLGYYRRARFLLEGAKMIVEGGMFPKTISDLQMVRGIGEYTAGAIASISFNMPVPAVDGNVIRVIARLKALSGNPKNPMMVKNFWRLAGQLVDPSRPGDFNQALMELGAIMCTPLSPSCSVCPVASQCLALSTSKHCGSSQVTDYPVKVVKAKKRHDYAAVCVVEILGDQEISKGPQSESGFLLVKRPDYGLLAGLWEFPSVLLDGKTDLAARREVIDNFLKKSFNLDPKKTCNIVLREDVGEYIHVFTHIRLKMFVELMVVRLKGGMNVLVGELDKESMAWKCVDGVVLSGMGLTSGVKKVHTMIRKFKLNRSPSNILPPKNRDKRKKNRKLE